MPINDQIGSCSSGNTWPWIHATAPGIGRSAAAPAAPTAVARVSSTVGEVRVSVFHSFEEVRERWRQLETDGECYAFQRYEWLSTWHRCVGAQEPLEVCITLVETTSGTPLMLLPLAVARRGFARCLVWLGGIVTDYQAPILARDCTQTLDARRFRSLWREIRGLLPRHDAVFLEKQPEYIGTQRNPMLHLPHAPNISNAHFTALGTDLNEFLRSRRSGAWLSKERKKERNLLKQGELSYRIARDAEEAAHFLQATMRMKSQSYKALGIADMFADPGHRRFFSHLTTHHRTDGFIHVSALLLNDEPLATHWGFIHQNRFYCYLPTYRRDEHARFSPGNALLRRLFEWCIEHRLSVFDFTIGDEPYKFFWCDQELRMFDTLRGTSVRGQLYVVPLRLARAIKRRILHSPRWQGPARALRARIGRWRLGRD